MFFIDVFAAAQTAAHSRAAGHELNVLNIQQGLVCPRTWFVQGTWSSIEHLDMGMSMVSYPLRMYLVYVYTQGLVYHIFIWE